MFGDAIAIDLVVAIPAITAGLIFMMSWCLVRGGRNVPRNWRRRERLRGEDGFAYSVTMILTLPFVMLVILGIVEMTGLMISMIGVAHAGSQAARASMVRMMPEIRAKADEAIRLAAVQAMVAYAPGRFDRAGVSLGSEGDKACEAYVDRFRSYVPDSPVSDEYLAAKFGYSMRATSVVVGRTQANCPVTLVTVRYEHPFLSSFFGAMLGRRSSRSTGVFVFELETAVMVPVPLAQESQERMEVDYDPHH